MAGVEDLPVQERHLMPRCMLDTDTCSYIMKRSHPLVLKRLQSVPVGDVCMSVVTKAELLYGVKVSPRRAQDAAALAAFLPYVEAAALDDDAALHYAEIRAQPSLLIRRREPGVENSGPAAPLDADLQRRMREPHGKQFGADIWGLGTMLYAPTAADAFVFGHDGQNDPAINAAVRINPDNGDAIIALTSGGRLLATRLASEWTYWQTGGPDFLVIGTALREAVVPLLAGWAAAIAAAVIYLRARTRTAAYAG